jgi:hypothetical protein
MWTTEYQRQFTWKSSIPSSHKVDSSTATTDQRVYRTAIASPRHTTMLRDDSAQTAPLLSSKSAQTTVPSTIIRLKETDTQTILSQPLVSVSTQSSPVAPVEMTSLPMEDRVAQYSPPHIPRRTEVLFDLERTKLPAAGLPSDYFVKGEAHLPQILSYGWANESPFVPALDHKTFNVKITPQEVY